MCKAWAFFENQEREIKNILEKATSSVYAAVAWLNFRVYNDLFCDLLQKGVKLKIVCDHNYSNLRYKDEIAHLESLGATIKLLDMPKDKTFMHHKFAIVDEVLVFTGSSNWSLNSERSMENVTVIEGNIDLVFQYMSEFDKLLNLKSDNILNLINLERSQCCLGASTVNILVFSNYEDGYDTYGDIVRVCLGCGEKVETIDEAVCDPDLKFLYMGYEAVDGTDPDIEYQVERGIEGHFNRTGVRVHAIGFVTHDFDKYTEDDVYTKIVWKNKFMSKYIEDRYDETYSVYY